MLAQLTKTAIALNFKKACIHNKVLIQRWPSGPVDNILKENEKEKREKELPTQEKKLTSIEGLGFYTV